MGLIINVMCNGSTFYSAESKWTSRLQVTKIEGLNPVRATLNWTKLAGHDGSLYNSGTIGTRNIVLTLALHGTDMEETRRMLNAVFVPTKTANIIISTDGPEYTGKRAWEITGRVESVEYGLYTAQETVQISFICPTPYFKDRLSTQIETTSTTATNNTELPAGFFLRIPITAATARVTVDFFLGSASTAYATMAIPGPFQAGDILRITSDPYSDRLSVTRTRSGETSNILGMLPEDFEFPLLQRGTTTMQLTPSTLSADVFDGYGYFLGV